MKCANYDTFISKR